MNDETKTDDLGAVADDWAAAFAEADTATKELPKAQFEELRHESVAINFEC